MDFSYSENQLDIQKLASEILADFASAERLKNAEQNGAYLDQELWQTLAEAGLLNACLPAECGGLELDYIASTLIAEAMGGNGPISIPYITCCVAAMTPLLAAYKQQAQTSLQQLLSALGQGKKLATTAFIEPGNEDPMQPSAVVKNEDGKLLLTGHKHCVPFAAQADYIVLFACHKSNKNDESGNQTLLLLDTKAALEAGTLTVIEQHNTATEPQYAIHLNNAEVTSLASGEAAQAIWQQTIAATTVAYCAMACGAANKMTRISAEYTSQRQQFGVAIATFQAVAHRLADCYIDTECLKIITLKAASDVNNGEFSSDAINMAKSTCGDVMHRISHAAQHVHGGMGIDRDYHLFRYSLWAKQLELVLGNSKQHQALLADKLANHYLNKVK